MGRTTLPAARNRALLVLFDALQDGVIAFRSPTGFLMWDGPNVVIFHGDFDVIGGVIQSGTITGFDVSYYTLANRLIEASGYSIDFGAFSQALTALQELAIIIALVPTSFRQPDDRERRGPFFRDEFILSGFGADAFFGNGGNDEIARHRGR